MAQELTIAAPEGGTFEAYLVEPPDGGPAPAIIVVPSIMGVTAGLKHTMERYANKGFYVIAADPFWRTLPGPLDTTRMQDALARNEAWTIDEGIADMQATLDVLENFSRWNHKWAVLGFCFGGAHAMFALSRMSADASVAFHGVGIEAFLGEAGNITKPFSFHFAEHDAIVPLTIVEEIRGALAGKSGEIFVYDGANHAFAQEESRNYSLDAATSSEERAFAVLGALK